MLTDWNKDRILEILLECARIAHRIKTDPLIEIKDDSTPVSNADREIEEYLNNSFGAENILGEETFERRDWTELMEQLYHGKGLIVDPIDGTANFINRRSLWAISIGYAENGFLKEGAVFAPERGELMISEAGTTWFAVTGKSYPDRAEILKVLQPAHSPTRAFGKHSCCNLSQSMTKSGIFTGTNPVISTGSCVCSGLDLVLEKYAVYMSYAKLWDLAGILPCLRNLDFYASDRRGRNLLDCVISPETYCLDQAAKVPFRLCSPAWIGNSREALETIIPQCIFEN